MIGMLQRHFIKDFLIKFTKNLHFRAKNKAGNLFLDSQPTVLLMPSVLLSILLLRQEKVQRIPQSFQVLKSHLPV